MNLRWLTRSAPTDVSGYALENADVLRQPSSGCGFQSGAWAAASLGVALRKSYRVLCAALTPTTLMIVAGEPSGDQLAAELVTALRQADSPAPVCFGAGGPALAAAGVELAFDLTQHAIIGLPSPAEYFKFRRFKEQLVAQARARRPDLFIGVDYFGFNGRLARALREELPRDQCPGIVQFVSPQVWASRPKRAETLAKTHDLLLSILPFEKAWYAQHAPSLAVEFVGHPMVGRHAQRNSENPARPQPGTGERPRVVLLPGSRRGEIRRHTPVLVEAAQQLANRHPADFVLVAPNATLAEEVRPYLKAVAGIRLQTGGLDEALTGAQLALASTGTVTLECAWFGVPFVALYRTSWLTYQIGRRLITVRHLAMPNLLASAPVAPECIQGEATPENLAREAVAILEDPARHETIRQQLAAVVASLGPPGAPARAALAIRRFLTQRATWFSTPPTRHTA